LLEEVKKYRSKVERLKELLDRQMFEESIPFEEVEELIQLLTDRYKHASTLAEKIAIFSLLQSFGVIFSLCEVIPGLTDIIFTKKSEENGEKSTNT